LNDWLGYLFPLSPILLTIWLGFLATCAFIVVGRIYSSMFYDESELLAPVYSRKVTARAFFIFIGWMVLLSFAPGHDSPNHSEFLAFVGSCSSAILIVSVLSLVSSVVMRSDRKSVV